MLRFISHQHFTKVDVFCNSFIFSKNRRAIRNYENLLTHALIDDRIKMKNKENKRRRGKNGK